MNRIESIGKNVEQAIENGLKELNTTRDKVNIKILETGGLFKKAKVVLTIEDNDAVSTKKMEQVDEASLSGEILEASIGDDAIKEAVIESDDNYRQEEINEDAVETIKDDKTTAKTAVNNELSLSTGLLNLNTAVFPSNNEKLSTLVISLSAS